MGMCFFLMCHVHQHNQAPAEKLLHHPQLKMAQFMIGPADLNSHASGWGENMRLRRKTELSYKGVLCTLPLLFNLCHYTVCSLHRLWCHSCSNALSKGRALINARGETFQIDCFKNIYQSPSYNRSPCVQEPLASI